MDGLDRADVPQRRRWVAALVVAVVLGLGGVWAVRHGKTGTDGSADAAGTASAATAPETSAAATQSIIDAKSARWLSPPTREAPRPGTQAGGEISGNATSIATGAPPQAVVMSVSSAPPVAVAAGPSAAQLTEEGDRLLAADRKDKARESYLAALAADPAAPLRAKLEEKLGPLSVELVTHPWPMAEKQDYVVQAGDSVKTIARKYGTTVELIVKGNELKRPDVIQPGQRLRVFGAKMEIKIGKSRKDLLLTAGGRFFKRYQVGTGRFDRTPVGTFVINERIPEPPWWRDDGKVIPFGDKENILGTRWMAIKATGSTPEIKGYGIHGTWDNASIGKAESAGCIRLRNEDIEELFQLVPVGTGVVIEE